MEVPALVMFVAVFLRAKQYEFPELIFLVMYGIHYVNRGLIYPLRVRGGDVSMFVAVSGLGYNLMNGTLNALAVFQLNTYSRLTLWQAHFLVGLIIWTAGFLLNLQSDEILMGLRRKPGDPYKIPYGGTHNHSM